MKNSFKTFAEAYKAILSDIMANGMRVPGVTDLSSVGSKFGNQIRSTKELLGYKFTIENPQHCILYSEFRKLRVEYLFGSFFWTIAASDSLDWISYYNERGQNFSDDGSHLSGAFGKRLLSQNGNQIEKIIEKLKNDTTSRRTYASILNSHDNFTESKEYPCSIGVQYFIRDLKLHSITYMRSQSAFMVLPYDIFLFVSLQSYLANSLGCELGTYTHISGSLHIYEDEFELTKKVLENSINTIKLPLFNKNEEPAKFRIIEEQIRLNTLSSNLFELDKISNSVISYEPKSWYSIAIKSLLYFGYSKLDAIKSKEAIKIFESLPPSIKPFFK